MHVTHLDGSSDPAQIDELPALLDELDDANDEELEVAAGDPYGWMVSAYASGTVVLSHAARPHDPELVRYDVPRSEALAIFEEVGSGRIDAALAREWIRE